MAATIKQKQVFKKALKGTPISKAMVEVGYSEKSNVATLTRTQGWQDLVNRHISDEKLAKAHGELLDQTEVNYFVFPSKMEDDEIIEHVRQAGFETIVVRKSMQGKLAFYSIINVQARKSALDMGYKLKDRYAAEKHMNMNVEVEALPVIKALTERLNAIYSGDGVPGDGIESGIVGDKAQDKE